MTFNGFTPPVSNYFRMPNEWIDICSEITNLAELKVVQYVLRHTWGFQEYDGTPKPITIDEFMHGRKRKDGARMDKGTGLAEMSVRNGLEKAIEHGYITCDSDERDKARIKKSYTLNMLKSGVQDLDLTDQRKSEVQDLGPGVQDLDLKTQTLDPGTKKVRPRSEKDTKERHLKKNTKERKNDVPQQKANVPTGHASLSSIHPSPSSQKSSFSSQEKQEVVSLTEEEQHVYDLACQRFFVSKPPEVTSTVKAHCAKIAKAGIKTLEQMKELEVVTRQEQHLGNKPIYLGNLARGLNGWLQTQQLSDLPKPAQGGIRLSSYDDDDYVDDTFYPVREIKNREDSHATR